jgi:hypothetical protein
MVLSRDSYRCEMTKINIEKINKLSDDVDKNALKVKNMVELQQKESLEATTFLLQNMDHIKYVLATHKFNKRHDAVIKYLSKNFDYYDIKIVNKILKRNGIFSNRTIQDFRWYIPFIVGLFIPNFIMMIIMQVSFITLLFINMIGTMPFFGLLLYIIEEYTNSKAVNYKIDPQYKALGIPKDKIKLG